jgi:hypothetical protein
MNERGVGASWALDWGNAAEAGRVGYVGLSEVDGSVHYNVTSSYPGLALSLSLLPLSPIYTLNHNVSKSLIIEIKD